MRERGVSLVEVVVVLALVAILSTIGTLRFNEYMRRSKKESQTRMIHGELMQARLHALTERRGRRVKLKRSAFEVYSSCRDDEDGVAPQRRISLDYPIVWNGSGTRIEIDDRGIINPAFQRSICLEEGGDWQLLDSVVVSTTRVNLGSRNEGGECESDGISVR